MARLKNLMSRRRKLWGLKRAAGQGVGSFWMAGLPPSGGRGAGASGISGTTLRELRTFAGCMRGAKPKESLTLFSATQKDDRFDLIFEATVPIVVGLASFIW
eukprot:3257496-Pyramimonas_sp.AAC.1